MRSEVKTISYSNGEFQRVQTVWLDNWEQLQFWNLPGEDRALHCFAEIYRKHLIPACPWIFGNLVLFSIPQEWGADLTAAAGVLQSGVTFRGKRPVFRNARAERLYRILEQQDRIRIVKGKLPTTRFLPVGNTSGFLTEGEPAAMRVNASFFIMDPFDCASVYDHIGTPFGLCVKDGVVLRPPLFGREALLVKRDGRIVVEPVDLRNMEIRINGKAYRYGENCMVYSRPDRNRTPRTPGMKLVIVGCQVAAVHKEKQVTIPASGFVLCTADASGVLPGDAVSFVGLEDVSFGIQVGNSILVGGEKTCAFRSRFYNIRRLQPVPFPPSLYPADFRKARAARIALGADKAGKPMLLWAEGAPKQGYIPGKDSCGASLSEMADLCADAGMENAVNLDGGGSAQILLEGKRSLLISDRLGNLETERPVPLGLVIK